MAHAPQAQTPGSRTRDLRLDFFRGLSLFFIFIDHIPDNILANFTLRSVAFCDAAEVFIFISGFTAALVYGAAMRQGGAFYAAAHIYRRVWQLYVAHIFLFVIFTAEVSYTLLSVDAPMYTEEMGVGNFLYEPHVAIVQALLLRFQPTFLDILPLYIVLLAAFPVILMLIHRHPLLALIPSGALYAGTQVFGWTLSAYPEGHIWFFNPFAWQFLFVLGAMWGDARVIGRRVVSGRVWLIRAASVTAAFAAIINLTWTLHWLHDPFPGLLLRSLWGYTIDKTDLAPLRLINFIALAVVLVRIVPQDSPFLRWRSMRPIILCGQNSLYIFCLGIVLSVLGQFMLAEVSHRIAMQLAISLLGVAAMIGTALVIAWYKSAVRRTAKAGFSDTEQLS
jgi:hypothetical protein